MRHGALFLAPIFVAMFLLAVSVESGPVIAAALKDPQSIFEQRSPGGRKAGVLVDTKPAPLVRAAFTRPRERVLGPPRERVLSLPRERALSPVNYPEPTFIDDVPLFSPPETFLTDTPTTEGGGPPGLLPNPAPPVIVGGPNNPETPVVPGPVPEPTTWVMNILGLFAVAALLRNRRRLVALDRLAAQAA